MVGSRGERGETRRAHETRKGRAAPKTREIAGWLAGEYPGGDEALFAAARSALNRTVGPEVWLRGLLEYSNHCRCDCYYCGIRRGAAVARFDLSDTEILTAAQECADAGFGSMTLQAGERRDQASVLRVERLVREIKTVTRRGGLPEGLGLTLSLGEQREATYRRWYHAGAHRYLLRVETSNAGIFARLHPPHQKFADRVQALRTLKRIGYQLGTGVMIGIPGQTVEDLAADVLFFRDIDADMIGMGPYIPSARAAPSYREAADRSAAERLQLSLRMIAVTRLLIPDLNIAATTALQALSPTGREAGLAAGANVMMPIVTPVSRRGSYQLYDGKPCVDEDSAACRACTPARAARLGRPVVPDAWGDAPHAQRGISPSQSTV